MDSQQMATPCCHEWVDSKIISGRMIYQLSSAGSSVMTGWWIGFPVVGGYAGRGPELATPHMAFLSPQKILFLVDKEKVFFSDMKQDSSNSQGQIIHIL